MVSRIPMGRPKKTGKFGKDYLTLTDSGAAQVLSSAV